MTLKIKIWSFKLNDLYMKAQISLCLFSVTTASIIKAFYYGPFIFLPQLWSSVLKEQETIKHISGPPTGVKGNIKSMKHTFVLWEEIRCFSFRCTTFQKMAAVVYKIWPQCVQNSVPQEWGSPWMTSHWYMQNSFWQDSATARKWC